MARPYGAARVFGCKSAYRFLPKHTALFTSFLTLACCGIAQSQALKPVAASAPAGAFTPNAAAAPAAGTVLHLVFGLSGVRRAERAAYLKSQYDASSPNYRKWLTPAQYGEMFGAPAADVQAVADYATAQGFHVTRVWPNRSFISVDAPVAAVESAFGVKIQGFDRPAKLVAQGEPSTFYAPSAAPSVPSPVASKIGFIGGLSNATVLHSANADPAVLSNLMPSSAPYMAASPAPAIGRPSLYIPIHPGGAVPAGTPFAGPVSPAQISTVYNFDALHAQSAQGDGQTIAVFSPTLRYTTDIPTFAATYGISGYAINDITIDGGATDYANAAEASVDIEVILGQANHATISLYESPHTVQGCIDAYNKMATDKPAVVTSGYGDSEDILHANGEDWFATAFEDVTAQLANQGVSVFNASGNEGAYDQNYSGFSVAMESASPNVTGVGGTTLPDSNAGAWDAENPWSFDGALGSGGGLSTYFAQPWWQSGPGVANGYSNGFRQVPDVAALAWSPYYSAYFFSGWGSWYGTQPATHLWAAAALLMDQLAGYRLGCLNPSLYDLGTNRPTVFHDIGGGSDGFYSGTSRWDFLTGWGSADFGRLYVDLVKPLDLAPFNPTGYVAGWNNDIMVHSDPASVAEPAQFDDVTTYYIDSSMANYGPGDMPSAQVEILVDSTPQTYSTLSLPPFNFTWTGNMFPQRFTAGRHRITEIVNNNHAIWESNYANNSYVRNITVVHIPQPKVTSVTPGAIPYGSTGQTLTINGSDFVAGAVVSLNGVTYTPASIAPTVITVAAPDALFRTAGPISVVVTEGSFSSTPVSVTVTGAPSSTTVVATPNPALAGTPVVLTATVADPSGVLAPKGTVTFYDRSASLGVVTLSVVSSSASNASLTMPGFSLGAHAISAVYSGSVTFAAGTPGQVAIDVRSASSVVLTASPSSSTLTQPVTFTATVTGSAGTPTGSVMLSYGSGTFASITLSGGTGSVSTTALPIGTYAVTATYGGNRTYMNSTSNPVSVKVTPYSTTTIVTTSASSILLGGTATYTATVTPVAPASGAVVGGVTFQDNGVTIGTATLRSGSASFAWNRFTAGTHTITASFASTASAGASSGTVTQTVQKVTPTVTLTAPSQALNGAITVTVAVGTVGMYTPSGNVTLYDGTTALMTIGLRGGSGTARLPVIALGSHSLTASYAGDSNYLAAVSAAQIVNVLSNATTTALTITPAPPAAGSPAALSVSVTPVTTGYGSPTGMVYLYDGGAQIGSATLAGGTATVSGVTFAAGLHSVAATYIGDATFARSQSAANQFTAK